MSKMSAKLFAKAAVCVFLLAGLAFPSMCELRNWTKVYQGAKQDVVTLMITGNYAKSRLLTDLIQTRNNQPYIIVPQKQGDKFYFVPAKGDGLALDDDKFTRFVKFLNPKNIIIIGDSRFVPDYYLNRIDKTQTFIRINNKYWDDIAAAAGDMLDLPGLAKDYKRLYQEIMSGKLYTNKERSELPPITEIKETTVIVEAPPAPIIEPPPAPEPIVEVKDPIPLK